LILLTSRRAARRWKRGEQAIGRSRGGRNTTIQAIADAKGRLLSLILTGGEAHDRPIAEPLGNKTKNASRIKPATAPNCESR